MVVVRVLGLGRPHSSIELIALLESIEWIEWPYLEYANAFMWRSPRVCDLVEYLC